MLITAGILAGVSLLLWLSAVAVHHAMREAVLRGSQVTKPETGYQFPPLPDISRMACTYEAGVSLARFDVPKDYWKEVVNALSPSQYDPHPAEWIYAGNLIIEFGQGRECRVELYWVGQHPAFPEVRRIGAFSAGPSFESRKYYRGGNEEDLKAVLTRAYTEYRNGGPLERGRHGRG
jgi:hypothetical protein